MGSTFYLTSDAIFSVFYVPFAGVLLVIFESRPDCLPQIAALALRSGNGLVLKGGKEAEATNGCLYAIVRDAIHDATDGAVSSDTIGLVQSHDEINELLKLGKCYECFSCFNILDIDDFLLKFVLDPFCATVPLFNNSFLLSCR